MKFGPIHLEDAEGAILAHRTAGVRKGTTLGQAEIDTLRTAGFETIIAARLEHGDLHEDAAADRIANAVSVGPGLRLSPANTGRVNVIATQPGLAKIDAHAVNRLNQVDPMITLATVPPLHRVETNDLLATIKIISYGIDEALVAQAEAVAKGAIGLSVPRPQKVALIETQISGHQLSDKGKRAFEDRLNRLGLALDQWQTVPHDAAALSAILAETDADLIAILTGSATSDIGDVGPSAVIHSGGQVVHFGMPVDPGNLLFLGKRHDTKILGLPGCARSPALNGADWVLERLLCDIDVSPNDIAAMGVGGLLKDIPLRGKPRRDVE